MSLDKICISKRAIDFHPSISLKQMESLLTIADNLEPFLRRINTRHRRKTKKLTVFNQIILRFKPEALCSVNNYKFTFTSITCNDDNNNNNNNNNNNIRI